MDCLIYRQICQLDHSTIRPLCAAPMSTGPKSIGPSNPRSRGKWLTWLSHGAILSVVLFCLCGCTEAEAVNAPPAKSEFNANRAYGYLKAICQLGPRPSGSPAMLEQQKMIIEHCEKLGAVVEQQKFATRHPNDGSTVELVNLIVRWQPELKDRIVIGAHYDTRPYPDRDPVNPRGTFIGANDGASGVALCMEMAHVLRSTKLSVGVDFVLFDGEEFLFDDTRDRDRYFLGSIHFAQQVAAGLMPGKYRKGVVVDMVADKQLSIYRETYSMQYAESVVKEIFAAAKRVGVNDFIPRNRHEGRDDHLPLNQIAKIPTVDLIDFDYPKPGSRDNYWHTEKDVPENCSGDSLRKVADVLLEWLKSQK
ncbi:MAG: M28 family peptidase [Pirellulaceae bacterium]|nr:M28 family peptidase [Pirellulaceae bacterium]